MALLGARNWYLPRWLRWLPKVHVEGRPEPTLEPAQPVLDRPTPVRARS
jgi:RND superfamily putative drug exporter